MATITVTSATDEALRAAVNEANQSAEDDVIRFAPDLAGATIRLTDTLSFSGTSTTTIEGDVTGDGSSDITISGDFDGNGTIDAGDSGTLIYAGRFGGIVLDNLRLTGSFIRGEDGGAVDAAATILARGANVVARNVQIDNAVAIGGDSTGTADGGAAATIILSDGDHFFKDVIFDTVSSRGGAGIDGYNGGQASAGILLFATSTTLAFNDIALRDATAIAGDVISGSGDGGSAVAGIYSARGQASLSNIDGSAAIFVSTDQSSATPGTAVTGNDGGALLGVADPGGTVDGLLISPLVPLIGEERIDAAAAPEAVRIVGFGGNDTLIGGNSDDVLRGGDDNDLLSGGLGDDTIDGGGGNDVLFVEGATFVAGAPQEFLDGGSGDDTFAVSVAATGTIDIDGGDGIDLIDFSEATIGMRAILGIDRLFNAASDNTPDVLELQLRNIENVIGSAQDDDFSGTEGSNIVDAGAGDDLIVTGAGDDAVDAGDGNDRVLGGFGNDTIFGGAGNDTLSDHFGANEIDGGDGIDVIEFDSDRSTFEITKRGNDLILTSDDGTTTLRNAEVLNFRAGDDVVETVSVDDLLIIAPDAPEPPIPGNGGVGGPTNGDDILIGTEDADFIDALRGNDSVRGNSGEDTLKGNAGQDTVKGGGGNDTVKGNGGDDRVVGQAGDDRVVGGGGDDTVIGSNGNDSLLGRGGDDVIRGGAGDDRILANGGDDKVRGNAGNDIFSFKRNDGDDIVRDFRNGEDLVEIRNGANSFDELSFEQIGQHVLMSFDRTTVLFQRTDIDEFDASDFLF